MNPNMGKEAEKRRTMVMLRTACVPLVVIVALWGGAALAQTSPAQEGLDRLRIGFYDMGVVAVLPNPNVSGASAVITGARLTSSPDADQRWSLRFEELRVTSEPGGWLSARSKGPALITIGVAGSPGYREFRIDAPDLEARIGPDGAGEEVGDWSIRAPSLRMLWGDENRSSLLVAQGVIYEGGEEGRTHASHRVRASSASVRQQWRDGADAHAINIALEGVDVETTLQSGGYLETYPWMAAIGAGMVIDADVAMRSVAVEMGVPTAQGGMTTQSALTLGGVSLDVEHDRSALDASWTVISMSGRDTRSGDVVTMGSGRSSGNLVAPLHASDQDQALRMEADVQATINRGENTWPVVLRVDADGQTGVPLDWFGFDPVKGVGAWRALVDVWRPTSMDIAEVSVKVGEGGLIVSGDLEAQEDGWAGSMKAETAGALPVLDVIGHAGVFPQQAAQAAVVVLQAAFGPDAGAAAQTLDLSVREGAVFAQDQRIFPPQR